MRKILLLLILFSFQPIFGQGKEIIVTGKTLRGYVVENEDFREVTGNVVMVQGDVVITCDRAIQNMTKNSAELIGNVIVTSDTVKIYAPRGFYFGNEEMAFSNSGVRLIDGIMELTAKNGYYYFEEDKAHFYDKVKLIDTARTLYSSELYHYHKENRTLATGKALVSDSVSTLRADTVINFRDKKETFAYGRVSIQGIEDNVIIFGDSLSDKSENEYTRITGNPFLMKEDTTESGEIDTLFISSVIMESIKDSQQTLIMTDSVKILRQDLASVNDITYFYRSQDRIETYKVSEDEDQPVVWNENTQLLGDSMSIFLDGNRLDHVEVFRNTSIISDVENYPERHDQISGDYVLMNFEEGRLSNTYVKGSVLSIYFLFEEEQPNGILKSSSEEAKILFEENKVTDVKLYGSPITEYHPENLVVDKIYDFLIPTYSIKTNKPEKNRFLEKLSKFELYGY